MASNTLTLPIGPDTQRKLRALAMLLGENVGNLETEIASYVDKVITERCIELLGGSLTHTTFTYQVSEDGAVAGPEKSTRPNVSFADAHKKTAGGRSIADDAEEAVEEAFAGLNVQDEISGHELSGDEDSPDNKSLEEQVAEEDEAEMKAVLRGRRTPNVGDNAEAFLEAAMGEPEERDDDEVPTVTRGYAGQGPYGERPRTATKSFESRMLKGQRASVRPFTGDED